MRQNCFFNTHKENNFIIKNNEIVNLYTPILGSEAISLYRWLLNENENQANFSGINQKIQTILSSNNIKVDQLELNLNKLEAFGLLETYYYEKENKIYFLLKSALSFNEFIAKPKFKHLLLRKIGKSEYERLEFIFQCKRIPSEAINISATFDSVFNDNEVSSITNFDFVQLHESIAKVVNCSLILSDKCKKIIENFFVNYNLTTSEIENAVFKAFVVENSNYIVDDALLMAELNNIVTKYKDINFAKQLKINRNKLLFFGVLSKDEVDDIYTTYNTFNTEQYLNAIVRRPLLPNEKELIKKLKDNFKLPDSIINLVIDFSYFRTNGHFNAKYIEKTATSILGLNLNGLNEVISYLRRDFDLETKTRTTKAYEVDGENEKSKNSIRISEWF